MAKESTEYGAESADAQAQESAQQLLQKLRDDRLATFQKFSLPPLIYYAYRAQLVGMEGAFYGVLAAMANNLANIWFLRQPKLRHLAAPLYIAGLYVLILGIAFVDNLLESPFLWFISTGPILASLTMGVKAVRINCVIATLVLVVVVVAEYTATGLPTREHPERTIFILRLVGLMILSGYGFVAGWRLSRQQKEILAQDKEVELARLEVESAAASKSEFLATMSHEIRTPMNGILGTAQHLAGSKLCPAQAQYNAVIQDSGQQLMDVLNAILDLSKIEAGRFELRDLKLRLDRVFRDVVDEVGRSEAARGLKLSSKGGQVPLGMQGDPTRVSQVLRNLLVALVSYAQGHQLQVLLESTQTRPEILFKIPDLAFGPEIVQVLEDPRQALAEPGSDHQRLALLMKVSHAIVDMMKGSLTLRVDPEDGTELRWCLCQAPVQDICELSMSGTISLESSGEYLPCLSVLVVDDNAINRRVARMQLEQMGCVVEVAKDGQEAVEMSQGGEFSAIFMDLHMPNLNGMEATKVIREGSGPNAQTPIIAFTADAYDADLSALEAVGMNGHLTKPFRIEALRRVLAKLKRPELEIRTG